MSTNWKSWVQANLIAWFFDSTWNCGRGLTGIHYSSSMNANFIHLPISVCFIIQGFPEKKRLCWAVCCKNSWLHRPLQLTLCFLYKGWNDEKYIAAGKANTCKIYRECIPPQYIFLVRGEWLRAFVGMHVCIRLHPYTYIHKCCYHFFLYIYIYWKISSLQSL